MKKSKLNKRKTLLCAAGVLVLVLLILQGFFDLSVYRGLIESHADQGTVLTTLIGEAVDNLNKPAPVDAASGKIYIPEARLVMPAYIGLGQVEYMYESGQYTTNNSTEVHLTSSQIINLAKNKLWLNLANANSRQPWHGYNPSILFSAVPNLQACTRGVQIFYSKQSLGGDYVFQGSHQLQNGRRLYVYSETDCQQDLAAIIKLAKQAQSY